MISNNKMIYNLENIVENKPITADLFLTNFCNNNCQYCTYKRWNLPTGNKYVTYNEFVRNVNILEGMGAKGFILTGGGEPTVNPDFDKITHWLETENISYGINTNFNKLKFIQPVYLKVSLDGYDEKSYELARGVNAYNKVIENIKKYIQWKKENDVKTNIVLQSVVINEDYIEKFYNSIKNLEVQAIVFRPIESTDGKYYENEEKYKEAQNYIQILKKLKEKDERIIINYKWNELRTKFNNCIANCSQIALNEFSEVIYCCHKPYEIIGHITDADILEKREKHLTNMKMCDVPCRLTAPNNFIKELSEKPKDCSFI